MQREKWNAYRDYAKDLAKQRGIKIDGKQYRLPPKTWVEPPSDWPEDLPALRAKEWNHILYGDQRGGGHSSGYGWIHDRTEFDPETTPEVIAEKLKALLKRIDYSDIEKTKQHAVEDVDGKRYRVCLAKSRGRIRVTTFHPTKKD